MLHYQDAGNTTERSFLVWIILLSSCFAVIFLSYGHRRATNHLLSQNNDTEIIIGNHTLAVEINLDSQRTKYNIIWKVVMEIRKIGMWLVHYPSRENV